MQRISIRELDSMNDDDFYDLVQNGRGIVLAAAAEERTIMVIAHEAWVPSLEDDIRDGVDWETATRSNWDLYAELRMNGVDFDRVGEMAAAMSAR